MSGFAKIFEDGDDMVLVLRDSDTSGNERVVFHTLVPGVGVKQYATVFQANRAAAADADRFFDAVDQAAADARRTLIRTIWAEQAGATGGAP